MGSEQFQQFLDDRAGSAGECAADCRGDEQEPGPASAPGLVGVIGHEVILVVGERVG